jgi:hypothetical protein
VHSGSVDNIEHLEGGTCKDSQPFVLEHLQQLFRIVAERGGWIVLSEDGLTNPELDFVKDASGLEVIEHLKFTKEVITPRTFEIYDHASLTWDEILIRLEQGGVKLSGAVAHPAEFNLTPNRSFPNRFIMDAIAKRLTAINQLC